MGYSKYVGRVGALAIALGIGVAVGNTPGVAWADEVSSNVDSPTNDVASPPADPKPPSNTDPSTNSTTTVTSTNTTTTNTAATGSQSTTTVGGGATPEVTISHSGGLDTSTNDDDKVEEAPAPAPAATPPVAPSTQAEKTPTATTTAAPHQNNSFTPASTPQLPVTHNEAPAPTAELTIAPSAQEKDTTPVARLFTAPSSAPQTPNMLAANTFAVTDTPTTVAPAQPDPITSLLAVPASLISSAVNAVVSFFEPIVGPGGPFENTMLWGLLAWARRETNRSLANQSPAIAQDTISLTVDEGQSTDVDVAGMTTDPDGDALTYTVTQLPENGTVTPGSTPGTFIYTPDENYDGPDSFVVTVSDEGSAAHLHAPGQGHTDSVAVDVTVQAPDGSPVITPNDDGTVDMALTFGSPGEFTDVSIPESGQPGAPNYWRVVSQTYDPETGKLTAVLEPTLGAQLLAGLNVSINDTFTLQATPVTPAEATFATFALRTAPTALAAPTTLAAPTSPTPLPQPPAAHLEVDEDAITIGGQPAGAVVTDQFTYVMNYEEAGSVTVIDNATNTIVKTIPTGDSPTFATLSGDDLYVVNSAILSQTQQPSTISVIDTKTNTVVGTIPLDQYAFMPAASPDGQRIYVVSALTGNVDVIDISDPSSPTYRKVVESIRIAPAPDQTGQYLMGGGVFNADGSRFYVPRNHVAVVGAEPHWEGDIAVIDTDPTSPTFNTVLDMDPTTPDVIDYIHIDGISPGIGASTADYLYLPTFDGDASLQNPQVPPPGSVAVIDINPNSPTYHQVVDVDPNADGVNGLDVGTLPANVVLSPDGSVAYVINIGDGTITAFDTVTNAEITSFTYDSTPQFNPGAPNFNYLASSPDGKTMFVTKLSDGTVTAISVVPGVAPPPSEDPGSTPIAGAPQYPIAVATNGTGYQVVVKQDTNGVANGPTYVEILSPSGSVTTSSAIIGSPNSSPITTTGGSAYLTTTDTAGNVRVSVISPSGVVTTTSPIAGGRFGDLVVASDGTGYQLIQNDAGGSTLVAVRPNGTSVLLPMDGAPISVPVLGPDGSVYQRYAGPTMGGAKVLIVAPGGGSAVSSREFTPAFGFGDFAGGSNQTAYLVQQVDFDGVNTSSLITVITASGDDEIPVTGTVGDIAVAPNGTAYTTISESADDGSGTTRYAVITGSGLQESATTPGFPSGDMRIAADGTVYQFINAEFETGEQRLAVVNQSGIVNVVSLVDDESPFNLVVGPDNNAYLWPTGVHDTITVVRPVGTKTVVQLGGSGSDPIFAPDGTAYSIVSNPGVDGGTFVRALTSDVATEKVDATYSDVDVAFDPQGNIYVIGRDSFDGTIVTRVSAPDGTTLHTYQDDLPGGQWWGAQAGADGTVYFLTSPFIQTGSEDTTLWALDSAGVRSLGTFDGYPPSYTQESPALLIAPGGKLYLTTNSVTVANHVQAYTTHVYVIDPATAV